MKHISWDHLTLENNKSYLYQIGKLQIYFSVRDKELEIGTGNSEEEKIIEFKESEIPGDISLTTYITSNKEIIILPALPLKPLVLKPGKPFKILPKNNIMLFIKVPIWLQIYCGKKENEKVIAEYPIYTLSDTWFGEQDSGEGAYSLNFPVETIFEEKEANPYVIYCPVNIINNSTTILEINRFLLHTEQLNLYHGEYTLMSNQVKIEYRGGDQTSYNTYYEEKPVFAKGLKKINTARVNTSKNIIQKSFSFFRSFSQQ